MEHLHLGSIWDYQEEVESVDELKQTLRYTSLELESLKQEKIELLNRLNISNQERDEARNQLQFLLNKLVSASPIQLPNSLSQVSLLVLPTKANSSITESNSFSHVSSPVDSFIDVVTSPGFSTVNVVDSNNVGYVNQALVQDYNCPASPALISAAKPEPDLVDVVIDALVKGKALPEKGKLVQAVMDAGPLLHQLLVAGPLPRWRNPPPLQLQTIEVPPFTIQKFDTPVSSPIPAATISCYPSQTSSSSMLNFAGAPSCHSSKRQRHKRF